MLSIGSFEGSHRTLFSYRLCPLVVEHAFSALGARALLLASNVLSLRALH